MIYSSNQGAKIRTKSQSIIIFAIENHISPLYSPIYEHILGLYFLITHSLIPNKGYTFCSLGFFLRG